MNAGLSDSAEDCSIIEINPIELLITNIDIFTAIHDDPYTMGKIAACNVTNDLFALNALKIVNYSNFIGSPTDIPINFLEQIIKGTQDFLKDLGTEIHGGHTIYNKEPLFGGSASAIVKKENLIRKKGTKTDDVLLITKPIGVQPVMAAYRVLMADPSWLEYLDLKVIKRSIDQAVRSMTTSNQQVTRTIYNGKYFKSIHAMTDVTGFGLIGHLEEMLENSGFGAEISSFPVLPLSVQLADLLGYRLLEGKSPEIAGAMLMAVDPSELKDFIRSLEDDNVWWHQIGRVSNQLSGIKFQPEFHIVEAKEF
ncbi:MAG: selenide, water dikinase SelD [Promethearchaeota archaeon]